MVVTSWCCGRVKKKGWRWKGGRLNARDVAAIVSVERRRNAGGRV